MEKIFLCAICQREYTFADHHHCLDHTPLESRAHNRPYFRNYMRAYMKRRRQERTDQGREEGLPK